MAEEELIYGHAKQALQSLTDRKKRGKERISDFFWEVFIIIVAVNITLWFHDWSEKRHDRRQVKEFLIDTRESLVQDTVNIRNYITFMTNEPLAYYDTTLFQISGNKIDAQYIDTLYSQLLNNSSINFNYSIYQSFSAVGNLRLIENRKLLSDIISLYSFRFPLVQNNIINLNQKRSDGFDKYIGYKIGYSNSGGIELSTIIHQPDVKYLIQWGAICIKGQNGQCEDLINKVAAVIHEIDEEIKK
ncbi:MAG: hypothetical protein FWF53_06195 [Candidatus Azobacteroides sp.]|nr:hypothetical protein [Candidatus Azobacteroides sp.]